MTHDTAKPRRHAAGQDPAKREAILNGAARVFLDSGFDSASVNDICRVADVSKSTLYVYFSGKEDLFEALLERERDRIFAGFEDRLQGDLPLREKLYDFAFAFAQTLCSAELIRSQRTVIAIAERMPELGVRFYEGGATRMRQMVETFLRNETASGTLDIPDITLAAYQLIELSTAGLWRQCLFSKIESPPPQESLRKTSRSAVDVFLAMYLKR
ncbi:TetR/AcrR family transcriptional regulator [Paracoccus seriniphilus]|uniref:TetR/AcrR family transcriptional regulator n=1 Tax=Paracoccus seriniphilus TaxID=184748 RepID=UPI003565E3DB